MKGAGKLSRKLLTILVLAAMPALGHAADNSIYIDQAGDFANVQVYQDGGGNIVQGLGTGGSTSPAIIRGNSVNVDINQTGGNNTMKLGIDASVASGKSVDLKYSTVNANNITGSNNVATFQLGTSSARAYNTIVDVTQVGGNNAASVVMSGSDNRLTALQSDGGANLDVQVAAAGTRQTITTSGGTGNSVKTNLTGDNGSVTIDVVGGSNTIDIAQSGSGTLGHIAKMDINGNSNDITLKQSGSSGDNTFNLKIGSASSSGNNSIYNITQKN